MIACPLFTDTPTPSNHTYSLSHHTHSFTPTPSHIAPTPSHTPSPTEESSLSAQHKTTDAEDEARLAKLREEDLAAKELALVDAREEYEGLCEAMASVALTRAEVLEDDARKSARKAQRLLARQLRQQQRGRGGEDTDTDLPFTEQDSDADTDSPPSASVGALSRKVSSFEPIYEVEEEDAVREEEDLEYLQTMSDFKSTRVGTSQHTY